MKIVPQVQPALQALAKHLEGLRFAMLTLREADGRLAGGPIGLGADAAFGIPPSVFVRTG